ncbi:hypothetical protein BWGOE4_55890 [Bacillus mycoides]|uniref:hypothetical protein n=1 Tax=Bacillus mycoides TaxID=1405 RepID=UPI0008724F89|nr:hypothetical protein [Bacillus mycoides]OFD52865.1 hypothetical protein BWGOE4_55890 [Bacillus mycoides]OFD56113.1 hypothetical protein BWGOE7_56180 [Bacillus mycoides]OFD87187.1 hypothetical protein BWGOE12_57630 [Bacillus mycoides]
MEEFKQNFEMKLGKEKKFYIHTNEHEYKFSLKKIHTEKETEAEENIVEWNPSKTTVVGIGSTVTVLATWISSLF